MLIKFIGNLVFSKNPLLTTVKCVNSTLMAIKRFVFIIKYYLELVDDFALLPDDSSGDMRPHLQYTRPLLAYRNPSPDAEDFTKTVIKIKQPYPRIFINISYAT
ncbi:hypothetical protein C5E22_08925 [Pectobacterium parmentieri]|uniref:Uncharacterized protein n=1 Tax=Pectobacterium parmentieri TaxID=1905730 RepID=A0A8B3FEN1_PECPM|nr:hypothetical protein A8F97_05180 [Pectobacterium parmentieri]AYH10692.1 hypothetical protein C5E24_13865 [Pectobacterium parmentieri]AYH18597.1 hypothetical protein C5E22_08925 [Pectobacterium parmentieri]AYH36973.1 hypothetical protein C5E17_13610 [Pectobacterium parmentieri]AZS57205.1 hypothetical protein C5E18_14300 [Pectobacterium parmentieri]